MKFSTLPQPVGLLKLMLNLLCRVIFTGENSADVSLQNVRLTLCCIATR